MSDYDLEKLKLGRNNLILAILNLRDSYFVDSLDDLRDEVERRIIEIELMKKMR